MSNGPSGTAKERAKEAKKGAFTGYTGTEAERKIRQAYGTTTAGEFTQKATENEARRRKAEAKYREALANQAKARTVYEESAQANGLTTVDPLPTPGAPGSEQRAQYQEKKAALAAERNRLDALPDTDPLVESGDRKKLRDAIEQQIIAGQTQMNAGDNAVSLGAQRDAMADKAAEERLDTNPLQAAVMDARGELDEYEAAAKSEEAARAATEQAIAAGATAAAMQHAADAGEDYGNKQRFMDQCYLMSNIKRFAAVSAQRMHNYQTTAPDGTAIDASRLMPFEEKGINQVIPMVGDPFGIVNKLIGATNFQFFNFITPAQLSSLTPYIRIYKVIKEDDGSERNVEIIFDTNVTTDDMRVFKSRRSRGYGSGFKSFELTYDGNNFFTAKKSIKADLVMHFDSFNELLRTRASPAATKNKDSFRYIDLALRTPSKKSNTSPSADSYGENYHIKAVLGWSPPETKAKKMFSKPIRQAIENSAVIISLIPVNHKFDIDELGRVTFNLSYRAFADTVFSTPYANVLGTPKIVQGIQKRADLLEKAKDEGCDSKAINDMKKEMSEQVATDRTKALSALIRILVKRKKVFHISLPYTDVENFNNQGPWADPPSAHSGEFFDVAGQMDMATIFDTIGQIGPNASMEELPENLSNMVKNVISSEDYLISFFYLGDLINIGMRNISECINQFSPDATVEGKKYADFGKSWKRLRVCVGDIEFINPKDESRFRVNICDVPVSMEYFVEWFMSRIISKGGEAQYLMANFIKDLMNNLLKQVAGSEECFGVSTKQRVHTQVAYLTGRPYLGTGGNAIEKLEYLMKLQQGDRADSDGKLKKRLYFEDHTANHSPIIPALSKVKDALSSKKEHFQYVIFYASRAYPYGRSGNYLEDASVGIYHYQIGSMFGLIKNIKFDKAEQPYLKEARFEQEGFQGLSQLREPYDVTISLFGNAAIFPGMYIYVDPRGLATELGSPQEGSDDGTGGSYAWQLGLGGYYMVIKVSNSVSPGNFETIVKAKWVGTGAKIGDSGDDGRMDPNAPCLDLLKEVEDLSGALGVGSGVSSTTVAQEGDPTLSERWDLVKQSMGFGPGEDTD